MHGSIRPLAFYHNVARRQNGIAIFFRFPPLLFLISGSLFIMVQTLKRFIRAWN